jgi:hypothetical protein
MPSEEEAVNQDDSVHAVTREPAARTNVSYSEATVLSETSKRRIVMVPFFIKHTDRTELATKIITYQKAPPPNEWAILEEKSVSLSEAASRELYRALGVHLSVAKENTDGSFLVIRIAEGTAALGDHDPTIVAAALMRVLAQPEIVSHLQEAELGDALIGALRGAIRLREMVSAVQELRTHLSEDQGDEAVYQNWCQRHTWAFGNAYVMTDEVREISPGDHLDLLLPSVITGYRDIVELKRPDSNVLMYDSAHRNFYFSADVSKAIGQCHRYLDVLHDVAASGLRDHPEIVAYHPRAIIVIGRSAGWSEDKLKALHGLNSRLTGLTVMTYDQLLAQGERLVELLSVQPIEEDVAGLETIDDFPF